MKNLLLTTTLLSILAFNLAVEMQEFKVEQVVEEVVVEVVEQEIIVEQPQPEQVEEIVEEPKEEPKITVSRGVQKYIILKKSVDGICYSIKITEDDLNILYRIVEAEATSGTFEQKANVAQCVINRIDYKKNEKYPIKTVVFAKNQFSPISDGRYYKVEVQQSTIDAVNSVIENPTLHKSIFFKAKYAKSKWFDTLKLDFDDGIHGYYSK